jgi:hypothetical protein
MEVFVAPGSNSNGDGSRARPFGTVEQARDHLRTWRLQSAKNDQAKQALERSQPTITLLDGTLQIHTTIEFDSRDDGFILRAAEGCQPRLIGGVLFTKPQLLPLQDEALLAQLPTDSARAAVRVIHLPKSVTFHGPVHRGMGAATVAVGSEVFVDGVAYQLARWPNEGFAKLDEVLDKGSIPRNRAEDIAPELREKGPERGGRFRSSMVGTERLTRWAKAENAWAMGYWFHDWAEEQLPIESIDTKIGAIQLGLPHRYGLKTGSSFYVTNLLEELDSVGEYYIDRAGSRLLLWPANDVDEEGGSIKEIIVSTLGKPLLRAKGTQGLELEGLSFEGTRGTAVRIDDGKGIRINHCRITNTGMSGIRLQGLNCAILSCEIRNIGATGVNLSGGDRQTLQPGRNRLENTRIHAFGRLYRTYQPAAQVSGVGQIVVGNEFAHAPHSAIIFSGNEHLIEGNEIFDVLRETGDSGAIYCGRDWTMHGNRIVGNFIHHLGGTDGRWQNAIYLDDMASGIEVAHNVIWKCHWGMLIGGGRDVSLRQNALIDCDLGISFDARGVGWMAKHIADPTTSTLHKRLAELPISAEPWASRYPTLSGYLDDRFGRPVGSEVEGNQFYATPFGKVTDRDCVRVDGNREHPEIPWWILGEEYVTTGERNGERKTEVLAPALPNEIVGRLAAHTQTGATNPPTTAKPEGGN